MTSFFYIESRFISVSGFSVCFHCFDTMWVIFVRSVLGVFLVFKVVVISLTSSQFVLLWRHILSFLLSLVFSEVILFLSCIIRDMSFEGNNTPTQLIVAPCTQVMLQHLDGNSNFVLNFLFVPTSVTFSCNLFTTFLNGLWRHIQPLLLIYNLNIII